MLHWNFISTDICTCLQPKLIELVFHSSSLQSNLHLRVVVGVYQNEGQAMSHLHIPKSSVNTLLDVIERLRCHAIILYNCMFYCMPSAWGQGLFVSGASIIPPIQFIMPIHSLCQPTVFSIKN